MVAVIDHATLNELEPTALANNHDLKAALSRLAQARASVRIAGASRYPTVGARLRSERTRAASATVTASDAELVVAFDPVLWGEQRGIKRSSQAQALAAADASANTALAAAANVAGAYFQLATFAERIENEHARELAQSTWRRSLTGRSPAACRSGSARCAVNH